jgi:pentose-5-phosphate-3-epimerase
MQRYVKFITNPKKNNDKVDHDPVLFQAVMDGSLEKVRKLIDASGHSIRLEIDGGVGVRNIREIADAGADMFVAGSAIFNSKDYAATITAMREELGQQTSKSH